MDFSNYVSSKNVSCRECVIRCLLKPSPGDDPLQMTQKMCAIVWLAALQKSYEHLKFMLYRLLTVGLNVDKVWTLPTCMKCSGVHPRTSSMSVTRDWQPEMNSSRSSSMCCRDNISLVDTFAVMVYL